MNIIDECMRIYCTLLHRYGYEENMCECVCMSEQQSLSFLFFLPPPKTLDEGRRRQFACSKIINQIDQVTTSISICMCICIYVFVLPFSSHFFSFFFFFSSFCFSFLFIICPLEFNRRMCTTNVHHLFLAD
jgi:hypothetical protein